ncbi:MAG: hypothetical protein S4CHLAM27_10790 [Chlamydiia bacterium]|nr:hypothetical protein [Chlamydiia bacterium]
MINAGSNQHAGNTNPAGNNFFQISIQRVKSVVSKVVAAVYEIFKHIDNKLTNRFYPKYREIARAVGASQIQIEGIDETEAERLLFFKFLFKPHKWKKAAADPAVNALLEKEDSNNNLSFHIQSPWTPSPQELQKKGGVNGGEIAEIETNFQLNIFLESIQFANTPLERSQQVIDNVCGLLFFLKEKKIDDTLQINTSTFEISRITIGEFAYNESVSTPLVSLQQYIHDKSISNNLKTVNKMIEDFKKKYSCTNPQNRPEHFMEDEQEYGDV